MKLRFIVCALLIVALTSCAGKKTETKVTYRSSFGFTSELSGEWLILTRDEVMNNPNLINFDNKALQHIDPGLLKNVKRNILSGRTEILYAKNIKSGFGDNINVMVSRGNLISEEQEANLCRQMPIAFKKMFKRTIMFYDCGLKKVAAMRVLYLNFEGVIPGTRSAQYQFQISPGKLAVATLTCKEKNFEHLNKVFDDFIHSIKIGQ